MKKILLISMLTITIQNACYAYWGESLVQSFVTGVAEGLENAELQQAFKGGNVKLQNQILENKIYKPTIDTMKQYLDPKKSINGAILSAGIVSTIAIALLYPPKFQERWRKARERWWLKKKGSIDESDLFLGLSTPFVLLFESFSYILYAVTTKPWRSELTDKEIQEEALWLKADDISRAAIALPLLFALYKGTSEFIIRYTELKNRIEQL